VRRRGLVLDVGTADNDLDGRHGCGCRWAVQWYRALWCMLRRR
jgi:hypothetical protein